MLVKVKAFPSSKKRGVSKKGDRIEVKVKEKARDNRANEAVIRALASFLNIPVRKLKMVKGAKKQNKIFEIYD